MTGVGPLRTLRQQVRKPICALALFSCVVNLLLMTGPLFMLQVYDRVLSSGSVQTLVALVILVVVLFAFMGTLDAMRSRVLARLAGRLDEILRGPVFSAVQSDAWRGADGSRWALHRCLLVLQLQMNGLPADRNSQPPPPPSQPSASQKKADVRLRLPSR
ncbi:MAG: hypothetical protein E5X64_23700 [Mesorhizobium sp.]|nr:MAG: hypothetical protein E5X64_23700 [Mesorhizobium sp.]